MRKKIIFRADGNSSTGLGHLYRLLAMFEMLDDIFDCVFLTKHDSTNDIIPRKCCQILIPENILLNDEPNWIKNSFSPDTHVLILDGYQFCEEYQKKTKTNGFSLIYIDDLVSQHMYADIVINHSPSFKKRDYLKEPYTNFALGTSFALLRASFLEQAKQQRKITSIDTVFVCFGGADSFNFSEKVVNALTKSTMINRINVVLGAASKINETMLSDKIGDSKVHFFQNLNELQLLTLMKSCNIAVVPTSTILFELLCVQIPIISGYFVTNQRKAYSNFLELGCFYGVGDFRTFDFNTLDAIIYKKFSVTYCSSQLQNQNNCIDGNQKKRIVQLVNEL
ncbi:MAG: UDP-2,4-diacetamido-2,4,6-trideoxy-beta-L-altropyranose hydrolase [Cellulophaga sp.]